MTWNGTGERNEVFTSHVIRDNVSYLHFQFQKLSFKRDYQCLQAFSPQVTAVVFRGIGGITCPHSDP